MFVSTFVIGLIVLFNALNPSGNYMSQLLQ
jgi:hypothetical protein